MVPLVWDLQFLDNYLSLLSHKEPIRSNRAKRYRLLNRVEVTFRADFTVRAFTNLLISLNGYDDVLFRRPNLATQIPRRRRGRHPRLPRPPGPRFEISEAARLRLAELGHFQKFSCKKVERWNRKFSVGGGNLNLNLWQMRLLVMSERDICHHACFTLPQMCQTRDTISSFFGKI